MHKNKLLIGISGKISSGKSTVARYISTAYNMPHASFGEYLKQHCIDNNLPLERKVMQDLGQKFINEDHKGFFQKVVFQNNSDKVVFESIRHTAGIPWMRDFSEHSVIIYLDTDDHTRYERYVKRKKEGDKQENFEEFLALNNHESEIEIDEIKKYADIVIQPEDDYEKVIADFFIKNKLL